MGLSVRIAPGVRLWAGPRGLGISTGIGPLRVSAPIVRVRGGGGARRPSLAQMQRALAQAQREEEIARWLATWRQLLSAHRQSFPPAQPPVAPPPEPVDEAALRRAFEREELRGLPFWRLRARCEAKRRARARAAAEAQRLRQEREQARAAHQAELDALWARLRANDPVVVLQALEDAFADNAMPAVPIDVEGARATVVLLMEPASELPDRLPRETPTGRLTLRALSASERDRLYREWVASHAVATVREALAAAPGLAAVTLVVLRRDTNPFGELVVEPLYVGTFARERVERLDLDREDVLEALFYADDVRVRTRGKARRLEPLDLADEPELAAVVARVRAALREGAA